MLCAQDYGIARGQTLRVPIEKCMAWSCFSVLHSAVILWEALVTNVGALKFQVSVWLMRKILSINTPCVRLSVKFIFTEFTQWSTWRKVLEIYSANLGINVGAHLSFLVVIKCVDIYTKCNYARPRSALCVQVVTR